MSKRIVRVDLCNKDTKVFFGDGSEMMIVAKTIIHSALIDMNPEQKTYFVNHKLSDEEWERLKSMEKK